MMPASVPEFVMDLILTMSVTSAGSVNACAMRGRKMIRTDDH